MKRVSYSYFVRIFTLIMFITLGVHFITPQQAAAQEIQGVQGFPTYQYIKTIEPAMASYDPTPQIHMKQLISETIPSIQPV